MDSEHESAQADERGEHESGEKEEDLDVSVKSDGQSQDECCRKEAGSSIGGMTGREGGEDHGCGMDGHRWPLSAEERLRAG